jgi:hypothetical protein
METLSNAQTLLSFTTLRDILQGNRREIILIVGMILITISLVAYLGFLYGVIASLLIYFGVKFYVGWQRKRLQGMAEKTLTYVCYMCENKFTGKECPRCGSTNKRVVFD